MWIKLLFDDATILKLYIYIILKNENKLQMSCFQFVVCNYIHFLKLN